MTTRSKRKIRSSRKHKSEKQKRKAKAKHIYPNSSSEESDVPYNREELEAATWRDKYRNQYNPNPTSIKAKLFSSPDDDILRLSTDEILRLSDSEEAVLKLRLEALKTRTELRELSPGVEIIEPPPVVVDLTYDAKDEEEKRRKLEEATLEEQELRLAALKSAYIKKSIARKRKKMLTERPYSPTDNIEKIESPQLTLSRDETDYSDNNMDISPINSPLPNDNDNRPIDMEIAPNSPVSFVEALFADDPLFSSSVSMNRNNEQAVEHVAKNRCLPEIVTNNNMFSPLSPPPDVEHNDMFSPLSPPPEIGPCTPIFPIIIPEVALNESAFLPPPPPPIICNTEYNNKSHAPPNNNDENLADISLEADCLRSLLLKNLKKKAKALQNSEAQRKLSPEKPLETIKEINKNEHEKLSPNESSPYQISDVENSPKEIDSVIGLRPPKSIENVNILQSPFPVLFQTTPLATLSLNKTPTPPKPKELAQTKSVPVITKKIACDTLMKVSNTKTEGFVFKKPIIPKTALAKPIGITKLKKAPPIAIKKILTTRKIENINILPKKTIAKSPNPVVSKTIPAKTSSMQEQSPLKPPTSTSASNSAVTPTPPVASRLTQTFESKAVPKLVIRLGNSDSDSDDFNMESTKSEKENTPNIQIVASNNNFEEKLDAFLKSARSRVEQTVEPDVQTPTKIGMMASNNVVPLGITKTVSTPVVSVIIFFVVYLYFLLRDFLFFGTKICSWLK